MFAIDGRDRPVARRVVEGAAQDERDDAERARSSSGLVVDLETGVRGYMLTDDASSSSPTRAAASGSRRQLAELARLASRDATRVDAHRRRPQRLRLQLHRAARPRHAPPSVLAATTEGKQRLDALRAEFAGAQPRRSRRSPQSAAPRRRRCARAWSCWPPSGAVLSVALLVLLGALPAPLRARPRPPRRRAAERLAHGHLDTRVPATGLGEIGQLGALVQRDGRGARRARRGPARPDRPPAGHPRPHDDDDLGQGPRRPLPAGQRAVAPRRWARSASTCSAAPTTSCSRPTSPPRSASPTSRSCAPARPPSTSATPPPAGALFHIVKFPLKAADGSVYATGTMGTDVSERQPRAGRGRRGLALEVRVPGQHEPRDPHAAQRRDRDDRAAAGERPRRRSSASTR